MKRISAFLLAAVFSMATLMGPAFAQDEPKGDTDKDKSSKKSASRKGSVEDQIKKLEMDRVEAVKKADVATLDKLTADDYTLINAFGQEMDKSQTMNAIKSGDIKITSNELSDLKVRVYGNTAVVTGKSDVKGTMGGKDISGQLVFSRVYVKKNGRWQAVLFQQTRVAS